MVAGVSYRPAKSCHGISLGLTCPDTSCPLCQFWLEDEKPNEATYRISRERAESSLGINFSSWEVTLKDTIESLKEKGFLSF
ncbi:hypothetical protein QYF36_006622 [Acer negundo]|nr:hypothetical protein QYF36_006622 [Acer negundo]